MATIRTAISLYDGVSGPLRTMHRAMNVVMDSFEALNTASSGAIDVSSIRQARAELSGVMSDFSRTEEQIRNADDAQNELNSSIRGGSSAADTLLGRFKSLVATVGGLAAIKKVVGLSDELASTKARLNLIVDQQEPVPQLADASVHVGLDVDDSQLTDKLANTDARIGVTVDDGGSVEELERKIMASAQRSRAAYFDTASAVASMGANAKAAFSSNDELISFIEQVNKQFVIGGADAQGQAAAMLQLKQAMGMGVLRGEELNSVLENAPGIARIIEQYMGIAEGSIKSYAEKGAVTAEVVKDALLGAADETNAAFESMPMTWGQIWTSMQNKALSIFSPILQRINDIANTDKFSAVTDGLLDGLAAAAKAGTVTLDVLLSIASAFIDNWGIIQPLIFGIAAAMLLYNGYLLTNNALTAISNIQKGIAAVQAYKAAAANAALSASEQAAAMSTASATAAQYGFNAALLSCPLTWVIVGIIAVVAAIYLIVAAINNMTGSAISATGIICGIFAVAASLILNTGIGVYNSFLAIIGTFVNFFLGIIEWVLNAANGGFDSFGGAVANLIGQIISWFLSLGQVVTTIIDAIFGTNWTAGLEDLKGTVTQWGKNDTAITLDRGDYSGIQRIQYSDAWDAGYSFGQSVDSKVSGLFDGFSMDSMGAFDFGNTLERIEQNSGFTAAKARLCYSAELEKVGMAAALSAARDGMRAATVGKYALFAGGYGRSIFGYSVMSSVDAYNTSLTKSTPTELSCTRCGHAAASVGGYALFASGASSYNILGYYDLVSSVDAYDASLTRSAAHIIGATAAIGGAAVGNYALFAGGTFYEQINEDNVTSYVLAYDSSLTFTTAPWLSVARANVKGASVGNYALFAGGQTTAFCTTVDAYNASLTRTTATALSSVENNSAAATVGNHAIFVGKTASADIYDASLTKTSAAILSTARTGLAATTVGDYAIFSGGGVADFCDASLTRSSIGTSMTGDDMGAATIGDYALFAGGHSGDTNYDSVEVYTA